MDARSEPDDTRPTAPLTPVTLEEATRSLVARGSPFEMDEVLLHGRRLRVWKHAPETLARIVERAMTYRDRTYLVYEGERHGYAQTFARVATLAHALRDRCGVRAGDRVALAMRNLPEWPIAFWAAACAGAVVVPLNAWWLTAELAYALEDSGARLVFVDPERAERLVPVLARLGARLVVARGAPARAEDLAFETLAPLECPKVPLPPVPLEPEDAATLFYTSGTTGQPKGALGTHRNLCTNIVSRGVATARGALRRGEPLPPPPTEPKAMLVSVPFFHVTGCHSLLATGTWLGHKLVLMHKWSPERALELIEQEQVNSFGGVPSMAWQVLESPAFSRHDTRSVEAVVYGGAPAAPELVRRLHAAFPQARPTNGYGLTECSALACTNSAEDYARKPDSVGLPVPVCDVRVVDARGEPLPPGSTGELCIRGPNIVKGYFNKPEATAETFRDGWLHTGDIARIDDEGFVYILDRAKDMILRGGENIYCVEVEGALFHHPEVMDAAVVGRPHPVLGEEPVAIVQLVPEARASEADLCAWVRERLAAFKVPVRVHVRAHPLPRNENGKIRKLALKRELGYAPGG
jgi:long-chain acyl-CoA synthetase